MVEIIAARNDVWRGDARCLLRRKATCAALVAGV